MTKKAIAFISVLLLMLAGVIVYIFSELYNENDLKEVIKNPDAIAFKEEYEKLNSETGEYRNLSISENNPFVSVKLEDIVKLINDQETFIVYFGFNECPWCRSIIESAIESALAHKIEKIYYVNIKDERDIYELDSKHKLIRTKEGSAAYYEVLTLLNDVLPDYSPLTYKSKKKTKTVKINEKRIYAPTFVMVKNGYAFLTEDGISTKQTDANMELTEEIKCEMLEKFNCFFDAYDISDDFVCTLDSKC